MTVTLNIGSWIVPLGVTVLSLIWVWWIEANDSASNPFVSTAFFTLPIAAIVSLIAWLIWALLK